MRTASDLLGDLEHRGVLVLPKADGKLLVHPSDLLTEEDRIAIRQMKPQLLQVLSDPTIRSRTIARLCETLRIDLAAYVECHAPDLLEHQERGRSPAESIIETCKDFGVALRIDSETGLLVVGKPEPKADDVSQPWPSLLLAIEAHLGAVTALVRAGWAVSTPFPRRGDLAA